MAPKNQIQLAEILGIASLEAGGPLGGSAAVGLIDGFPVAVAWTTTDQQKTIALFVRFAKDSLKPSSAELEKQIVAFADVRFLTEREKLPNLELTGLSAARGNLKLLWFHTALRSPSPEAVADLVRAVLGYMKSNARPLGGACETCGRSPADLYCVESDPVLTCAECLERMQQEDRRSLEAYEALPSNPGRGFLFGAAVAAAMALIWGVTTFGFSSIPFLGAILMGSAIAWAINRGMGKINNVGRALTLALTTLSVLGGDFIYTVLLAGKQFKHPLDLELVREVSAQFIVFEFVRTDRYLDLICGFAGALYVLYKARPPVVLRKGVPIAASRH